MTNSLENPLKASLFHEHWWLEAATGGAFSEVEVRHGDDLIGRLPFVLTRRKGAQILQMPHFTHLLGPVVNSSDGKLQTRIMNRLSTVGSLIDQIPSFDFFRQTIDPSLDDGLAIIDGLAFQTHGFQIGHQYSFEIDCRTDLDSLLAGMHFKVRQHIRRAEEKRAVETVDDPRKFVSFYVDNLRKANRRSYIEMDHFPDLFSACRTRNCGEVLTAVRSDGRPVAMTFLVWDSQKMYYLMSTRDIAARDSGSANLLVWSAMTRAHERGLLFDLDGVSSEGMARFLTGFGGSITTRLVVTKQMPLYRAVQAVKTILSGNRFSQLSFS